MKNFWEREQIKSKLTGLEIVTCSWHCHWTTEFRGAAWGFEFSVIYYYNFYRTSLQYKYWLCLKNRLCYQRQEHPRLADFWRSQAITLKSNQSKNQHHHLLFESWAKQGYMSVTYTQRWTSESLPCSNPVLRPSSSLGKYPFTITIMIWHANYLGMPFYRYSRNSEK